MCSENSKCQISQQIPTETGLARWLNGKESACNAGNVGSIPGLGTSPREENGNPLQYSYLGNLMDRGAWQATDHGVSKESDSTYGPNNNLQKQPTQGPAGLSNTSSSPKSLWIWPQHREKPTSSCVHGISQARPFPTSGPTSKWLRRMPGPDFRHPRSASLRRFPGWAHGIRKSSWFRRWMYLERPSKEDDAFIYQICRMPRKHNTFQSAV